MSKRLPASNYTQVPNVLLDDVLPEIKTLGELKVTLAIARQTFGWQRGDQRLSISRLQALTGLEREATVKGAKDAVGRGYVSRRPVGNSFSYSLNVEQSVRSANQIGSVSEPVAQASNGSDSEHIERKRKKVGKESRPPVEDGEEATTEEGWVFRAWRSTQPDPDRHSLQGAGLAAIRQALDWDFTPPQLCAVVLAASWDAYYAGRKDGRRHDDLPFLLKSRKRIGELLDAFLAAQDDGFDPLSWVERRFCPAAVAA